MSDKKNSTMSRMKRPKFEALSPFLKSDVDDVSRDSGIGGCDSAGCSPIQQLTFTVKSTPTRRLDFIGFLSPTDMNSNADDDVQMKAPSHHFSQLRQPSPSLPLSPIVSRGTGRQRTSRRLYSRTSRNGTVTTASPLQIVSPSDVCRRAEGEASSVWQGAAAVTEDYDDSLLIGDFSRPCSLPVVTGKHADLHSISPDTLARVLEDEVEYVGSDQILTIDCRYPYEYEAGHIKGAINIYTKRNLQSLLLKNQSPDGDTVRRPAIVIFHCEFSSKRGPSLARFLRQCDRTSHADNYPLLSYPELYVLEGGYKAFYERHSRLCSPQAYVPMLERSFEQALRQFRAECKRDSRTVKQNNAGQFSRRVSDDRPRALRL